ncbi:MAG: succinate dehydrogenase flavoprotein subunit [Thiomicrorhabdus chilensis]|uniref:succinate dehydrogenase flavoprotein subunit n=1 Tax=Thiomicrorhabdus chilensis TaxID=63656 RepID=UPI00299DC334|nr:succinate dehydrogenase flavoprotein subunit [Thiomicrorhabdus chilensis]MDX1348339.1 succinate dehydrogenase flavoprotein subunit [Thiomicrorhabdus chilensis]
MSTAHNTGSPKFKTESYEVLVVGAGGAGMRAALALTQEGHRVAMISKVFPTRSHTVAAQGGINAALGNVASDDWSWHMYDTIKGSDYLGDQDAIEFMCQQASEIVRELDHFGVPFSRLENGKIYQRAFGGQSQNFGEQQAYRTCAAADRTGHAILHSLYQQNIRLGTTIYEEYYALDLILDQQGEVAGLMVMNIHNGDYSILQSRHILLATGGAGQIFRNNTNASINTGDGLGMVLRAGLPLQDMEFWQFHPTGVAGKGMLISEAARGEGGLLRNALGEAFMQNYAPKVKDLASRDVVARAIATEVQQGRGCGPEGDFVLLDLTHLDADTIKQRLPGIRDISLTFLGVDPVEQPIPIFPTCHYMMGGIPTNLNGQVVCPDSQGKQTPVKGLFAVGECACVSVHGANRLGGNSLLDILVFGRQAAKTISQQLQTEQGQPNLNNPSLDDLELSGVRKRIQRWQSKTSYQEENLHSLKQKMQRSMERGCGVFRNQQSMQRALQELEQLETSMQQVTLRDHGKVFNLERLAAYELENLMAIAKATVHSALARTESRGAHSRIDFQQRDDTHWLKHSLYFSAEDRLVYKSVNLSPNQHAPFTPKARVY